MAEINKIEQVLDFAINEEKLSAEFYTNLAAQAESPAMREVFEDFAREELRHKAKLEAIKANKAFNYIAQKITDLKIADYLVEVTPTPDMDYRGALILAMKKEKAAFKLYSDLAEVTTDKTMKEAFLMLAQEEAKHKLGFEIEYDNMLEDN